MFIVLLHIIFFFFFNDTATTEIYTLSYTTLFRSGPRAGRRRVATAKRPEDRLRALDPRLPGRSDRKSTRLNSSHMSISYAVFCLKKTTKNTDKYYSNKNKKYKVI